MKMKTRTECVREAAVAFAELWVGGNRRFVLDEIVEEPATVQVALVARMLLRMNVETQEPFIRALEIDMEEFFEEGE